MNIQSDVNTWILVFFFNENTSTNVVYCCFSSLDGAKCLLSGSNVSEMVDNDLMTVHHAAVI